MAETSSSSTKASKGRPSPQEIEEKRRQRAEKKIQEAERKAQQERQGLLGQQSDGSFSFAPRSWALVRTRKDNRRVGIRFLSWKLVSTVTQKRITDHSHSVSSRRDLFAGNSFQEVIALSGRTGKSD